MLRKPKGSYPVSICRLDTEYLGSSKYKRKLSLMIFYPSENGQEICPYMDVEYQKNAAAGQSVNNGVDTFCYVGRQNQYDKSRNVSGILEYAPNGKLEDSIFKRNRIAGRKRIVWNIMYRKQEKMKR